MRIHQFISGFGPRLCRMTYRPILVVLAFVWPVCVQVGAAPEVSLEMFEELKKLPRVQQEALARQYGIDPKELGGIGALMEEEIGEPGDPLEPQESATHELVLPRIEASDLPRFGANIFDKDVSTFAPVDNIPVPEGYLMGPGDTLNIMLYGKEQSQQVFQINREGAINFPRLGAISLAGLRFEEAKQMIEQRIARQMIGTEVIVSLGRLRSISVFLAGEVKTPGSYSISALSTVTQALYVSGGITEIGSLRNIQVRRGGSIVATFDVYDLMLKGEIKADIRLQSGDVLFVPTVGPIVTIAGAVLRPGEYELRGSQNLSELVEMAGGVLGRGYVRLAKIERYLRGDALPSLVNVDLSRSDGTKLLLQDGDSIHVDQVSERQSNPVEFIGSFSRKGKYAWFEGSRFSDYVRSADADLLQTTDLSIGLIARRRNEKLEIDVLAFDLNRAMRNPKGAEDLMLRPHDQIFAFDLPLADDSQRVELLEPVVRALELQASLDEMVETVGIEGAVRVPGKYPLLQGGSVDMLVRLAGGLKDGAYLKNIEVRRINSIVGDSAEVQIINVSFDSQEDLISDLRLQSRDVVHVSYVPGWSPEARIVVSGEFVFPGTYLISPGETLSSIVRRSGGITPSGFSEGTVFTRLAVKRAEERQMESLSKRILRGQASKILTAERTTNVVPALGSRGDQGQLGIMESLTSIEGEGRLVIDLAAMLAGDSTADLLVQDGDEIEVPVRTATVSVMGEVHKPGSFRFDDSLSLADYIEMGAGVTTRADAGSVYVVKANGSVVRDNRAVKYGSGRWLRVRKETLDISEGDAIVVPINQNFQEPLTRYREVSTVIFQGIVSIATLLAL